MTDIKVGDVVQLNSGGPYMTVVNVERGTVYTNWFIGAKLESADFEPESLTVKHHDFDCNLTVSVDDRHTQALIDDINRAFRTRRRFP